MIAVSAHSGRCLLRAAMMFLALSCPAWSETTPAFPLVPWPERVTPGNGAYTLVATTRIQVDGTVTLYASLTYSPYLPWLLLCCI